jgi:ABC transporter
MMRDDDTDDTATATAAVVAAAAAVAEASFETTTSTSTTPRPPPPPPGNNNNNNNNSGSGSGSGVTTTTGGIDDSEEGKVEETASSKPVTVVTSLGVRQSAPVSSLSGMMQQQDKPPPRPGGMSRRASLHMGATPVAMLGSTTTTTTTSGDDDQHTTGGHVVKNRRDHLQRLFYRRKLKAYMLAESQSQSPSQSANKATTGAAATPAAAAVPADEVLRLSDIREESGDDLDEPNSSLVLKSIAMHNLIGDDFHDDKDELIHEVMASAAAAAAAAGTTGATGAGAEPVLGSTTTVSTKQYSDNIRQIQVLLQDLMEHVPCFANTQLPVEIRMKDFSYLVRVEEDGDWETRSNGGRQHASKIPTVYNNSPIYPFYKLCQRAWRHETLFPPKHIHQKHILSNISLYFEPGKSYLVLGPPGSGKTTLLKALAGRIVVSSHGPSLSSLSLSTLSFENNNNDNTTTTRIPKEATRGHIYYNGRTLQDDDDDDDDDNHNVAGEHQRANQNKMHSRRRKEKEFHMENVIHYM